MQDLLAVIELDKVKVRKANDHFHISLQMNEFKLNIDPGWEGNSQMRNCMVL